MHLRRHRTRQGAHGGLLQGQRMPGSLVYAGARCPLRSRQLTTCRGHEGQLIGRSRRWGRPRASCAWAPRGKLGGAHGSGILGDSTPGREWAAVKSRRGPSPPSATPPPPWPAPGPSPRRNCPQPSVSEVLRRHRPRLAAARPPGPGIPGTASRRTARPRGAPPRLGPHADHPRWHRDQARGLTASANLPRAQGASLIRREHDGGAAAGRGLLLIRGWPRADTGLAGRTGVGVFPGPRHVPRRCLPGRASSGSAMTRGSLGGIRQEFPGGYPARPG
jgi:hypothetical protein